MELTEFIKETLKSIATAVEESKETFKSKGGEINPNNFTIANGNFNYIKNAVGRSDGKILSLIEFEVVLSKETKEANAGGIGVLFGAVNLGGKIESGASDNAITKIKFEIPVVLP